MQPDLTATFTGAMVMIWKGNTPMAMNSVNTNLGSMVALQSLNRTSDQLSVVQKRISTGMRVADCQG
jgi:hypothetical protein